MYGKDASCPSISNLLFFSAVTESQSLTKYMVIQISHAPLHLMYLCE